jgi:preprotein translocase subunit SecG
MALVFVTIALVMAVVMSAKEREKYKNEKRKPAAEVTKLHNHIPRLE